ncbi:MAG TPA: GNAT family N-acetyltransferase [Acidimicrobiales bacterium]|nr:GNAT family N-acetyltransferase [Acidimicrobiales bacterium]
MSVPGPLPLPDPELADPRRGMRLRPWRSDPRDAAALAAAWADPAVAAGSRVPDDPSPAAARRWIAGEAERRARGLALDLVVGQVGADDVWGEVGLRGLDPVIRRAEVGWWLAPEVRGCGVAATAVDLLASWALGPPLGLHQVWARIDPDNAASVRVASDAGFRLLGTAGGTTVWSRARAQRSGPARK